MTDIITRNTSASGHRGRKILTSCRTTKIASDARKSQCPTHQYEQEDAERCRRETPGKRIRLSGEIGGNSSQIQGIGETAEQVQIF